MTKSEQQDLIVDAVYEDPHGILLLSPRVGKTKIAIDIIKQNKYENILWVTESVKLRDVDIPAEFKKWSALGYLNATDVICYGTLKKIPNLELYDIIILDEIQNLTPDNGTCLLPLFSPILGLTGTMPKHEEKLDLYKELSLKILYEIGIEEAVDQGLIADYEIKVHKIYPNNTLKNIKAGSKAKPFMTTEYKQLDYINKSISKSYYIKGGEKLMQYLVMNRMHNIYNSPTKTAYAKDLIKSLKGRILIFAGSIAQAEELCKHTYHSKTNNAGMFSFQEGIIDTLACVNSGGTGFTYTNVDHFIIVQANSNKKGDVTQKVARSFMKQKDYKASVHIIELIGTQDTVWVNSALESFEESKVTNINN